MRADTLVDAVVLRHRWWAYVDEPESCLFRANGNRFTANGVVRIAKAYAVRRGLNLPDMPAADDLASVLSEKFETFDGDLNTRAERVLEIAETITRYTHGTQVSAVSKFAWFAHPDSWTMYDSRARKALCVASHITFYGKLLELDFYGTTAKIDRVLTAHGLRAISASRVIDSYLLLRSAENHDSDHELAAAYLSSLPKSLQDRVRAAATEVAAFVANDDLIVEVL